MTVMVHVAAAALVDADGLVLVAERLPGTPLGGLWEFPGGKIDAGETPEAALVRELDEELGIAPTHLETLAFASHPLETGHLVLLLYLVRHWSGAVTPRLGQRLQWVTPSALVGLAMPPADGPLVAALTTRLQRDCA